jgi:4-phytase/acid phosphatase
MMRCNSGGLFALVLCSIMSAGSVLSAQAPAAGTAKTAAEKADELKMVVMVSRHGVRSPLGKVDVLNEYSRQPWPAWSVPEGYLTEHGAKLMRMFGAFDREQFVAQGLLAPSGCGDAEHIRIHADSDQRTILTGKELAAGLAPGCTVEVRSMPENTLDPLYRTAETGVGKPDKELAVAALLGRIGGDPNNLTEANRPQLQALEEVLLGCNPGAECGKAGEPQPKSLFDIPATIAPGKGSRLYELHSPLGLASAMAANLLLEYTEGMDAANVGWGRVDIHKLRELMPLTMTQQDLWAHTGYIAREESSNLLSHILQSMEQTVKTQPVAGALSKPGDRLLILVGHDSNIAAISGVMNLTWIADGTVNETSPGGALLFELWKNHASGQYSVRTYYTAQTLDQMRNSTPLSLAHPPLRLPVYVPGCGRADGSCAWTAFEQMLKAEIDPEFVK